jgi:hypothetical protein
VDGHQLDQLECLRPCRRNDLDVVAFFLVEDRAADRGGRGDHPLLRVGIFRHDELVDEHRAVLVAKMHRGTERRLVARNALEIHELNLADALLQHRDPRIDNPLPLFRRFVFRVLAQVAVLARALDLPRQVDLQLALERGDFIVESLENAVLQGGFDFSIMVGGWWLVVSGWWLVDSGCA